jgi:hypothetical protein
MIHRKLHNRKSGRKGKWQVFIFFQDVEQAVQEKESIFFLMGWGLISGFCASKTGLIHTYSLFCPDILEIGCWELSAWDGLNPPNLSFSSS